MKLKLLTFGLACLTGISQIVCAENQPATPGDLARKAFQKLQSRIASNYYETQTRGRFFHGRKAKRELRNNPNIHYSKAAAASPTASPTPKASPTRHFKFYSELGISCFLNLETRVSYPDPTTGKVVEMYCDDPRLDLLPTYGMHVTRGPMCTRDQSPEDYCKVKIPKINSETNKIIKEEFIDQGIGDCIHCDVAYCNISVDSESSC